MSVVYLTLDQVIEFHSEALSIGGGGEGLRSYDSIASAVYQPQQTFGGLDLYPTIAEKAAAYGYFVAESQAFIDGNKRTAVICMLAFLDLNGYELRQSDQEIEQMFVDIGSGVVDQGNFFGWVCNHARPINSLQF